MTTPLQRADAARRARQRRHAMLKVLLAMLLSTLAYWVAPRPDADVAIGSSPADDSPPASAAAALGTLPDASHRRSFGLEPRLDASASREPQDGFEPVVTTRH